ncbi:phosphatase PAP2 family protein [Salinarimonas soli]|uniref:Phosphatase PAP2 family protein n=1 Tax=Salinarimonas soli TaxID=1638099 RepID=A0A5B2V9D1_9HYPH|nr:phosphatase PAP2 family protein [Salinarimonas soli]KAA2234992.1 phosphatase PAP2 family protein [Salinarimonas soli]
MMSRAQSGSRSALALWSFIGFASAASVGIWVLAGIGLKGPDLAVVVLIAVLLLGLDAFYSHARPDPRIARLARGMAELLLLTIMIGALSYSGATLAMPLWDGTFQAWDEALGFDWRFWLSVLDANPALHHALVLAYHSMLPQLVIAVAVLAALGRERHLDTYLLAYGLAALATVSVAALMPALSPLVHLGLSPADHPNIVLAVPLEFQEQATALREGRMRMVDLSGAQGLVTFPSFHTVCAVLLLLAFRPVPYLRWIGAVLNGLMLVAIPIEGSHYLVDVIAGAALALAGWALACRIVDGEGRREAASGFVGTAPATG